MSKFSLCEVDRTLRFYLSQMCTFSNQSYTCFGKNNKQTNLLELPSLHNHDPGANSSGKIIIGN